MFETIFFSLGLGFSLLVYFRSIRPGALAPRRKALYFTFTLIGITGTLWLFGVLAAHFLRKLNFLN